MWYLPCGFMSAMCGTFAPMRLKSSSSSSTPASNAIASRCRTRLVDPPTAITDRDRVLERGLGHDLARPDVRLQKTEHRAAALEREVVAPAVDGRRRRAAGQRHAERLGGRRHRVGGEHPRARALGRTRAHLDLAELVLGERAGGARADRLEHAHDVEGLVLVVTGEDRAAVEEDGREVEARRGHQHAGQALVAACERDHARRGARRASRTRSSRR